MTDIKHQPKIPRPPSNLFDGYEDCVFIASRGLHPTSKTDENTRCYTDVSKALYAVVQDVHDEEGIIVRGNLDDRIERGDPVEFSSKVEDFPLHLYYFSKKLRSGTTTGLVKDEIIMRKAFVVPSWKNFLCWKCPTS